MHRGRFLLKGQLYGKLKVVINGTVTKIVKETARTVTHVKLGAINSEISTHFIAIRKSQSLH